MKIAQLLVDLNFLKMINERMESHGSFMWLLIFFTNDGEIYKDCTP